jgi:HEAT repeat protein
MARTVWACNPFPEGLLMATYTRAIRCTARPTARLLGARWPGARRRQASGACRCPVLRRTVPLWLALWVLACPVAAQAPPGSAVGAFRTMLHDKAPEVRMKAAEGLGRVGGRQSVMILREALQDRESAVRATAVDALGYIGGSLAMTVLTEALKDRSPQVRMHAVEGLRDAGTVSSIPLVRKAFEDQEEGVRLRTALVLRQIGHRRTVPALARAATSDKSAAVRAAAAEYLGRVGVKDARAAGILSQVMQDPEPAVRLRAVESLGLLQTRQAISALEKALQDRDPAVRVRATEVLGHTLARDFE